MNSGGEEREDVDEFQRTPDDGGVAQQFADGHRHQDNPGVGAHIAQRDADGGAQQGHKGEESHPRAPVVHEVQGTVEFFLAHAGIFLNPLNFSQMADPVASHAAAHVARECDKHARDGIHVQRTHTGDDQRLAAEGDDASCQERPQEQPEVAPLGKEMNECIKHYFRRQLSVLSCQFSVVSFQLSVISLRMPLKTDN